MPHALIFCPTRSFIAIANVRNQRRRRGRWAHSWRQPRSGYGCRIRSQSRWGRAALVWDRTQTVFQASPPYATTLPSTSLCMIPFSIQPRHTLGSRMSLVFTCVIDGDFKMREPFPLHLPNDGRSLRFTHTDIAERIYHSPSNKLFWSTSRS
jgi:hypothetical protein